MMNLTRLPLFRFLFVLLSVFAVSCTKGGPETPVDTELIQGNKPTKAEKAFYHTKSATSVSIILTKGIGEKTSRVEFKNNTLESAQDILPSLVRFSADQKVVTLLGSEEIFEYSPLEISTLPNGSVPPPAKVESVCLGVSTAGYEELRIEGDGTNYSLVGITPTNQDVIGGNGTITKSETATAVSYSKSGFGVLQIDKTSPSSFDTHFFRASFSVSTPSPWKDLTTLYCHLNSVSVVVQPVIVPEHIVFITKFNRQPHFGGLAGADEICETFGKAGSKTSGALGKWRAILSQHTGQIVNAKDRIKFSPSAPLVRTNGDLVLPLASNFWNGGFYSYIWSDEDGQSLSASAPYFWSATQSTGLATMQFDCNGWNSASVGYQGGVGDWHVFSAPVMNAGTRGCETYQHLLCINSAQ